MGIFRTTISVAAIDDPLRRQSFADVMIDIGSEYSWFPALQLVSIGVVPVRIDRFETADGRVLERAVGFAIIRAGGSSAPTIVVFAEPGDMTLMGVHALEGLNLRVDVVRRALVPAGPVPAAVGRKAGSVPRVRTLYS